jgi:hypothetical protein
VGDFVYVDAKSGRGVSQIFLIENMFTTKEGVQTMYANQVSCILPSLSRGPAFSSA